MITKNPNKYAINPVTKLFYYHYVFIIDKNRLYCETKKDITYTFEVHTHTHASQYRNLKLIKVHHEIVVSKSLMTLMSKTLIALMIESLINY